MGGSAETRIVRWLLTGDSKSANKAMEDVEKSSDKTGDSLDETGKKSGLLSKAFGGLKNMIGYGVGALGLGTVAFGLKDVISGGKQWQEQQAQLQNALKNTGQAGKQQMDVLNKSVERSATHGGFSPIEEARGLTQLIQVTGKASTAVKLNAAAVNLARGAHLEYSAALKIVARAQAGTAGRAQQYLGIIQPVKTYVDKLTEAQKKQNPELLKHAELLDKQATALQINEVIAKKYGNATAAYSKTASGAMSNFKNTLDLLEEDLGRKLLPAITKVGIFLASMAQGVMNHSKQIGAVFKTAFGVVASVIRVAWPALAAFAAVFLAVRAATIAAAAGEAIFAAGSQVLMVMQLAASISSWSDAWALLNMVMDANPVGIVIVAVAALIAILAEAYVHIRLFREIVQTGFAVIKLVVGTVVGFIIKHWKLLLATLSLPAFVIVEIIKNFTKIKKGVETVFGGIASFVGGVFHAIVGSVETGINLVIKAINKVIEGYNYVQKHLPFGLGAGHVNTIGELGKSSSTPAAPAPYGVAAPTHAGGKDLHIHLHLGAREVTETLISDPWSQRHLAESVALHTLQRQARA